MSHNIIYFSKGESDSEIQDYLIAVNYTKPLDKFISENLRKLAVNSKSSYLIEKVKISDNSEIPISKKDVDSVKIIEEPEFVSEGNKNILIVSDPLYDGLILAYKVETVTRQKLGKKQSSFESFINSFVIDMINSIILTIYNKKLEDSEKQLTPEDI